MPALVTPFTRSGDLDLGSHVHNLGVLADHGIKGWLLAGSTGEGSLLDPGERAAIVESSRQTLGRRHHLMVGIWGESVRQAVRQVEESAEAGADSVLVVTPTTLARRSVPHQVAYFKAVAKASPVPMLLYSVPPNTGYSLDAAAAVELAGVDNIVGMKDSGGDAVRIQRIIAGAGEDFQLFNGATRSLALAMAAGARGAITASTNYMPDLVAEVIGAGRSPAKAMPVQHRATAASDIAEVFGVPGVKHAAEVFGLRPGEPRAPLSTLPKKSRDHVAGFVRAI
jgi:dihydrodipicolinate synthase/N-acetylneuraminate lyase